MSPISMKVRVAAAITAIGLAGGIVACSDNDRYDRCNDYSCGDGLFLVPLIIPPYGIYGQPGYRPQTIIQPGSPNYRPTYQGKPPNFTPPSGAKVNPPGAKPPANYKPPNGATLTVQKAPKQSGNTMPSQQKPSGGSSSGGSKQTVQKAPSGGSKSGGSSSGGSKSGGSSSGGSRSGGSSSGGKK